MSISVWDSVRERKLIGKFTIIICEKDWHSFIQHCKMASRAAAPAIERIGKINARKRPEPAAMATSDYQNELYLNGGSANKLTNLQ